MTETNHLFNGARADEIGLHGRVLGGDTTLTWNDIQRITIRTTDGGPFLEDVFIVVGTTNGHIYAIPQSDADGEVLAALQTLEGFDNEAVIRAMGSTTNAEFVLWERTTRQ